MDDSGLANQSPAANTLFPLPLHPDRNHHTPLHLAASMGNVEMCRKIGGTDPSLIARRNVAGETPLFLAALNGRKQVFLWLHYQYMSHPGASSSDSAHCIRDNGDTILHCTIAQEHFGKSKLRFILLYAIDVLMIKQY